MTSESDVMDTFEAARFLGVHAQTLRKLSRRNAIPCFKIGKDWRFRKEALVRWADEQRSGCGSPIDCSAIVVDDEEKVCAAMADALQRLGCRVRQATSGAKGLELVAREVPDLILLDLKMPNMNGPGFLAELRKKHPTLPVVVVTGYPESDLVQQAMKQAPVLMLAKPVELELLERTVRSVLGERTTAVTR